MRWPPLHRRHRGDGPADDRSKIAEPGKAGMLQPPRPQDPRLHMPALHLAPDGLQQFAAEVIGQHAPQDDEIDIEQRLDVKTASAT